MRSALAACMLLLCLPLRAAEVPEAFRVFSVPVKATMLLGKQVLNPQGEPLGTVSDLMFDLENNRVRHAIVELQKNRSAYPLHALKLPPGRGHVVLEIPEEPIEQAWDDARLVPASKLLGGQVVDVVIDAFWGNVAFAVLELGGALRPVPLDAFGLKDGEPVLLVERDRIEAIDGFTRAQLDAHLTDRDFLQRNARNAHQLTPLR